MQISSNNSRRKMRICLWRKRDGGFTYWMLMVIVAVMGIVLATVGEVWHIALKREKEQELLFIGSQFRRALTLYYEHTPPKARRYPSTLEDLLHDPRYAEMQRYLRKVYVDPITGSPNWGLIKGPDGEIFGVYSLSEGEPIKKGHFRPTDKNFEGKTKYSEWVFMHSPGQRSTQPL
jgi:type II secretory pathway pseudopilin PulG